jgi:hypothetical protein
MRLLLDECLPRQLKRSFRPHLVLTVPDAGWGGLKNGALLSRAVEKFDVFLTIDDSIEHQQNLSSYKLIFIIFEALTNDFEDLRPLVPAALQVLATAEPGKVYRIRRLKPH